MASENEASCESDPNFAVICGFLEKFGVTCGLGNVDFLDLQYMLENNTEVPQQLIDLHVKLLRKARKSVSTERWERALVKVCHGFGSQDAWEIERFGYRKARLPAKLRILKQLLEMQFDLNSKFKTEVNKQSAEELRTQPLGRDLLGHAYWFQADDNCQIRVYKEDPDEETWDLVAKDREELAGLITHLSDGKEVAIVNEDSNSVESEKPITDTGQIDVPITKLAENEVISTEHNIVDVSNNKEELICNGDKMSDVELENSKELDLEKSELITTNGTNDISTAIQPSEELKNTEKDSESVTPQDDKPVVSETIIEICDSNITSKEVQQDSLPVTQSVPDPDTDRFEDDAAKLDKDDILTGTPIALNQQITEATEVQNFSKSFASEVVDLKTGVNLTTVKSVSELHSVVEPSKRPETFGVKEKYMRSDISGSSSAHHRKAVDSAGYSLHTKYLKNTMNDDEEELSEPTYMKRPRLDRPTLLGYKKKKMSSESSDEDEYEDSVSDEVEEPLMLVKGEGFGHENKDENRKSEHIKLTNINDSSPIVGDVVEEPVLYFTGEGSGHECETGKDIQDKESTHADQPVQDVDNSSLSLNNSICNISNKTFKSIDVKSNKLNEVVGNVETNLEERNVHQPDVAVTESRPEGTNNLESNASILNSDLNLPEKDLHNCIGEKTLSDKNFELETGSTTTSKHTKLDKLICSDPSQVDSEDNLQLTKDSGDLVQLNDCTHSDDKEDSSNSKIQDSGSKAAVLNNAPDSDIATKIAIDVVEEAASDKNFSIYLKEKSRIKLKTSNCSTDIVNNVKQSYSKPRPKKILNYKPKIVDTLGCKKTDNIKLDIKESSLESSKLHANMITACNVEKQETPNCIELDNGILDKDVNNESIDKRITSKVQETVKKQSTGSKEDSIKSRTGGKGPDCNQNENGTEECRPTSKRATLNSSLVVENSKVSKTLENSNINPTRSSTRTRSAQNQSDKLDKTKHSGLPKMVKNKSKIEKSTSKPKHNENEADSETTAEKPEESKRELRHRTAKGITNVTVSKKTKKKDELTKKNEICNSSESNSNDGEQYCHEIEAVDKLSESPATETKIQPVEASFTQLNEHCGIEDQDDDDMEIDDTVNKIANIVEIERQIIKPSEMNLIKDVEIKTVKNLINKETISDVVQDTKVCGLVPVNEPKCVKRSLALLTCIDINKLKGSDSKDDASDTSDEVIDSSLQVINTIQEIPVKKELETEEKPIDISDSESGGKSTDVVIVGDSDPLTISEESDIVSKKSTTAPTLSSFKLDVEDSIPAARLTRKRAAEQSANNTDSSKRPKVKGKHALSHTLRHSIEKQKLKNISSSEEDVVEQKSPRIGKKKSKRRISKHSDGDTCSQGQSSDGVSDSSNKQSINKRKKPAPRKKTLLGLDISPAVENILTGDDGGIRQSRRIAQIKIKEEAERRKLEELALQEHKDEQRKRKSKKTDDKDYEVEKRKPKPVTTEDETTGDVDSEEKKKRKRKRKHGQFDASKPWKSSSGSSSSEIEEEEEEVEAEECDYRHVARSDHEFSPESDLEGDKEWMPLKRARTVRKGKFTFCYKCVFSIYRVSQIRVTPEKAWASYDKINPLLEAQKTYPFKFSELKLQICSQLSYFQIDEWNPDTEKLIMGNHLMQDELAYDAEGIPIPELDGSVHDLFANADADNHGVSTDEEESEPLEQAGINTNKIAHIVNFNPGDNHDVHPNEYSYSAGANIKGNKRITQVWAGPSHWKLKHISRTTSRFSGQPDKQTCKTVRKSRTQPILLDFYSDDIPLITKKLYKIKRYHIFEDPIKCTLPQLLYTSNRRCLMSKPVYIKSYSTNAEEPVPSEVGPYNYENPNDSQYCSQHTLGDDGYGDIDGNDGDFNADDDGIAAGGNFEGNNLIDAPEMIPKTYIHYALQAKKMDMKKLKKATWQCLVSKSTHDLISEDDMYNLKVQPTTFGNVYKLLPGRISDKMKSDLSCPLAFVAILHLANEQNLQFTAHEDLLDFNIEQINKPIL